MLLERLAFQTRKTPQQLLTFSESAGLFYKVFDIEKRTGGLRRIEQPSKSVKAIQRWLDKALFRHYPIHNASMGYRLGLSIRDNAERHALYPYTLRMDFKDFFWSFTGRDVGDFFLKNQQAGYELSSNDIAFIVGMVTRNGRLVMGAPSSPALTNIMMFEMDHTLEAVAKDLNATYTRYADDLFFSSMEMRSSREIEVRVTATVNALTSPHLTINTEKTSYLSRKSHRAITGLVVTPQGEVSLGRDRKRKIKALLHKAINGQLELSRIGELAGFLNWSKSADPAFVSSLRAKYGTEIVDGFSNSTAGQMATVYDNSIRLPDS